jgi:hypothetical protein
VKRFLQLYLVLVRSFGRWWKLVDGLVSVHCIRRRIVVVVVILVVVIYIPFVVVVDASRI